MRRALIPLVFVAALLCAGCSDGSGPAEAEAEASAEPAAVAAPEVDYGAAVRTAVAAMQKSSARIDEEILVGGGTDGGTDTFVVSIDGDFDWAGNRGRLGVGLSSPDSPGKKSPRVDEIFHDGTVYVGGFSESEGRWGSIRQDRAEAHYLLRAPVNDPRHVLEQVAQMREVKYLGEDQVDGMGADHYRGELGWETVTLRMAKDVRAQADVLQEMLGSIPVHAEVWVDGSGRLVRTRLDWITGEVGSTVATMNLTDHGKTVRTAVPAGGVVPVPTLSGPLAG
ncbi:hypothetical protein ACIBKZ_12845 [Streptomyces sp. NPDC050421]|uniref:hypothetical protein n=1 Tax=Streptomyces sp. NPDC050421 TaxID=3365613 RepID=UPI00378AA09B